IRILFSDDRRTVTVTGTRPYDGAPGGWRATMTQMDTTAVPYGDIQALHPAHDFIPTISALSIATSDLFYDVDGDPALLSHTPFDAVYFPTTNQEHVEITAQNAAWLRAEIQSGLVDVPGPPAPAALSLAAGPNPFHHGTRLEYRLATPGDVDLAVFDVGGRRVARLATGHAVAG